MGRRAGGGARRRPRSAAGSWPRTAATTNSTTTRTTTTTAIRGGPTAAPARGCPPAPDEGPVVPDATARDRPFQQQTRTHSESPTIFVERVARKENQRKWRRRGREQEDVGTCSARAL